MKINKQILITGITGFVGQNLSVYLADDFDVKGITRKGYNGLTYEAFLEGSNPYDVMIHLAGKAHDLKKTSNDNEYYEVNFELTKKLYNQFLQSEAKQFIYISSVKAVVDSIDGILTEDAISNPVSVYGKSKRMAEDYILANLPETKKVYILRPCMIHGPLNKGNLNLLFGLVQKGFPWPLGAFNNQRSFLSVENLCFVIKELLIQETILSGVYNIADDDSISTNELVTLISKSQNKKARILSLPKKMIINIARTGDFLSLPLNMERLHKLTESFVVCNLKIKQAINKPFPVNVKDGLLKTFTSFKM
ncbi:NAD-dependent epimerase/dehydratase family protein [Flavobacterium sp. LM4]|uniref:NAD-dependent epimerase/dehydratase family protein n=1 Tax=Flavobacterium sp. LM4 TaxID=1938609 RepID=UPI0009941063|nr:NAD-dependent epimerase/dehydratase family protein [Flavobacterium sp. LM4]OOV20714.1 nucleoside-diphosphate-sugar epimerase [Flavobacterium sp. LM4]